MKSDEKSIVSKSRIMLTVLMVSVLSFISFNSNAATGKELWSKCMACHTTTDKAMVGPGLKGITDKRSEDWLAKWIRNSQELIDSGDKDAIAIYEEYNKVPMTAFPDLTDEDISGLLAYITEEGNKAGEDVAAGAPAVTDPGAGGGSTPMNTTWLVWGIFIVFIAGIFAYRFSKKTKEQVMNLGFHPDAHKVKNYPAIFVMFVAIAAGIIYVLTNLLNNNTGMVNTLMFVVLPYASFLLLIAGSIYRYKKKGFQVSSLSSQFIEGKKLFWGSQPFHWGILIIFFGHLIAFLFPRSILAWNGEPVRLLILEISSFAFGLAALMGLILLIKRRLETKTLLVVTNKMDMVVYTVLLTQIVSGLGVAFFLRWGSSWFASVLTPYLRSIFSFNPDITAVQEMHWLIQIHIISAFVIIGIIPFTRFMHFLVAPVDYIWRKYQVVIWNWNRKAIRNSTQHTFGKKTRNH